MVASEAWVLIFTRRCIPHVTYSINLYLHPSCSKWKKTLRFKNYQIHKQTPSIIKTINYKHTIQLLNTSPVSAESQIKNNFVIFEIGSTKNNNHRKEIPIYYLQCGPKGQMDCGIPQELSTFKIIFVSIWNIQYVKLNYQPSQKTLWRDHYKPLVSMAQAFSYVTSKFASDSYFFLCLILKHLIFF